MIVFQETVNVQVGRATPGPIEQPPGLPTRAAILLGPGRALWVDNPDDLLALYNAVGHQLTRMQQLELEQPDPERPMARPYIRDASELAAQSLGDQANGPTLVPEPRPTGSHHAPPHGEDELRARAAASAGLGPVMLRPSSAVADAL